MHGARHRVWPLVRDQAGAWQCAQAPAARGYETGPPGPMARLGQLATGPVMAGARWRDAEGRKALDRRGRPWGSSAAGRRLTPFGTAKAATREPGRQRWHTTVPVRR